MIFLRRLAPKPARQGEKGRHVLWSVRFGKNHRGQGAGWRGVATDPVATPHLSDLPRPGDGLARTGGGRQNGASRDSRDAWFIGCTGGLIIGIWRGNDDSHPMRDVVGGGSLARLFAAIAAGG